MQPVNLFRKIFSKHLEKGKEVNKLADDIGGLSGVFSYKKFTNDKLVDEQVIKNALTNQSKTALIRLISQNVSPWTGQINPASYKISKMRFGNFNWFDYNYPYQVGSILPNALNPTAAEPIPELFYYDISEASYRPKFTPSPGPATFEAASNKQVIRNNATQVTYGVDGTTTGKPVAIFNPNIGDTYDPSSSALYANHPSRPPTHFSVFVDLLDNAGNLQERITFYAPYDRRNTGILPTKIATRKTGTGLISGAPVITHSNGRVASTVGGTDELIDTTGTFLGVSYASLGYIADNTPNNFNFVNTGITSSTTKTRLFYDYKEGSGGGWKVQLDEFWNGGTDRNYSRAVIWYTLGGFNVINSIVPVQGANSGSGTNLLARYGSSIGDSYAITQVQYQASSNTSFVDDNLVTFSANIPSDAGNNNGVNANPVEYTEAFLMMQNDDVFSVIQLSPSQRFTKTSDDAYLLSWSIQIPS